MMKAEPGGNNQKAPRRNRAARFAAAVGADESVELVKYLPALAPAVVADLAERVSGRLRSTGGRPTDPDWQLTRLVPFSEATWERLREISRDLSDYGRRVAPSQIAAMLVEDALTELSSTSADTDARALDEHLKCRIQASRDGNISRHQ